MAEERISPDWIHLFGGSDVRNKDDWLASAIAEIRSTRVTDEFATHTAYAVALSFAQDESGISAQDLQVLASVFQSIGAEIYRHFSRIGDPAEAWRQTRRLVLQGPKLLERYGSLELVNESLITLAAGMSYKARVVRGRDPFLSHGDDDDLLELEGVDDDTEESNKEALEDTALNGHGCLYIHGTAEETLAVHQALSTFLNEYDLGVIYLGAGA